MPRGGRYIGASGSLNVSRFGTQNVHALGLSDVYQNGVRVSSGSAAGPARVPMGSEIAAAPSAQLGYFQNFADSPWLWGAKFAYSHLGSSTSTPNALLPQSGSFTNAITGVSTPSTGNAVVRSYQASAERQVAFTPFLGRSNEGGFIYLGGGPSLTRLRTNLNGLVGFADINGTRSDVSGAPRGFSSAGWVLGGMVTAGFTYLRTPGWFLDFSYTASTTQRQAGNYFSNPGATQGAVTQGSLIGNFSGALIAQGAMLMMNCRF